MALLKNCMCLRNVLIPYSKQLFIRTEIRNIARWVSPTLKELKRRRDKIGPEPERPRSAYLEWNYEAELSAFGPRLSEEFDISLLRRALLHRSYKPDENTENNTALIKEGEEMITRFILDFLGKNIPNFPDEGKRSVKNYLMSEQCLSYVAKHIGLKDIVLTAEFPVSDSTLSSTFKAIVAALYHSSGEKRARNFVKDILLTQLHGKEIESFWEPVKSAMEQLQEYRQANGLSELEPRLCNSSGQNTILAAYRVGLYDDKKELVGIGWGENIEVATDVAARNALSRIYGTTESRPQWNFGNS